MVGMADGTPEKASREHYLIHFRKKLETYSVDFPYRLGDKSAKLPCDGLTGLLISA